MLSLRLIARLYQAGEHARLLRAVVENGLELPGELCQRLACEPAAVVGLTLRRVVELTYGPTVLTETMTRDLLARQQADGSFGSAVATAAAGAALGRLGQGPGVATAHRQAVAALAAMQEADGLWPGDGAERELRPMAAAAVLLLLAEAPAFHEAVDQPALRRWFAEHWHELDEATRRLYRRAQVSRPASVAA